MFWLKRPALSLVLALRAIMRSILHSRRDIGSGLRMMLVIFVPLLIAGPLARRPGFADDANFLVLGALFVGLAAPSGSYGRRARTMALFACLAAGAGFGGTLLGHWPLLALVVVVFWTFGAGMLLIFGREGGTLCYVATVCLVIPLAEPANLEQAWLRGILLLSGALWALIVMVWDWPFRRFQPLRQALVAYYHTVRLLLIPLRLSMCSHETAKERDNAEFWLLRTRIQNARKEAHQIGDEISPLSNATARRLTLLLKQTDALFEVQTDLVVSLRTLTFQTYPAPMQEVLTQAVAVAEKTQTYLVKALQRGKLQSKRQDLTKELQEVAKRLAVTCAAPLEKESDILTLAHLQHIASLFKRLIGICQGSLALMENAKPDLPPDAHREPRQGLWPVLTDVWQTLATQCSTRSRILRYALRLSSAVSLATALSLLVNIPHGYWIPMSVVILLKPDFHTTHQRIAQRLSGTIVGGLLAGVLSILLYEKELLLLLMALCCFLAFLARPRRYGVYAFFLTAFLVFSTDIGHPGNWTVALVRVVSNLVGAVLAYLAVSWLWPRWEYEQLPDQMSKTISALQRFYQAVMNRYLAPSPDSLDLKQARQQVTRECLRTTTLVERLSHEPHPDQAMLAHAAMRLTAFQRLCESLTVLASTPLTLDPHDAPVPGLALLIEHLEQAFQKSEEGVLYERNATKHTRGEEYLQVVQDALRVVALRRQNEQMLHTPPPMQHDLLGRYASLSMHLPSLVRQIQELVEATCASDICTISHP